MWSVRSVRTRAGTSGWCAGAAAHDPPHAGRGARSLAQGAPRAARLISSSTAQSGVLAPYRRRPRRAAAPKMRAFEPRSACGVAARPWRWIGFFKPLDRFARKGEGTHGYL
jgi:hypothetical protein